MRFSACYKIVKLSGFFWNQRLLRYGARWCGRGGSIGFNNTLRRYYLNLSDGLFGSKGTIKRRNTRQLKFKNLAINLLEYTTPFLTTILPWVWYMLLNLQLNNYKSYRYRLSLPSRGQRSRSNKQTTKKTKSIAVMSLLNDFGLSTFGYNSRKQVFIKKQTKTKQNNNKAKPQIAPKGGKKTIRTKKKDIWR